MTDTQTILQFVTSTLLKDKGAVSISPDDNLFLSGLLDSLDVVRLVQHLEQENNIKINAGEITLKNFKSINAITGFIARKTAAS